MKRILNKTYEFSEKEVLQALADFVYKETNEGEYVNPENFTIAFLDDEDKSLDVNIVSIFSMDYK